MIAGGWIFIPLVALEAVASMTVLGAVLRPMLRPKKKLRMRVYLFGAFGGSIVASVTAIVGDVLLQGTAAEGTFAWLNRAFIAGNFVAVFGGIALLRFLRWRVERCAAAYMALYEIVLLRWAVLHVPPEAFTRKPTYVGRVDPFGLMAYVRPATVVPGAVLLKRMYDPDRYEAFVSYHVE